MLLVLIHVEVILVWVRWVTCTALLELLDHAIEIGIPGAKAARDPVPTALGNRLAVSITSN
jgi:hypothetical protein